MAGELANLTRIEDLGMPVALQDLFQGGNAKISIHGVGQPPGQNLAAGHYP